MVKINLKNVYRDKKVFVTGHTGFKGSWLISWLNLLGAQVKGFSLAPEYKNGIYNLINGDNLCQSVIGDINDSRFLEEQILDFQPDFIFHLAAQSLVRYSYNYPSETFLTNIQGTVNILDAIRKIEKKVSTVIVTTDKVYQNNEWDYPYRESDKLGGYDPYSASKACVEIVVDSYRNSFFNPHNYSTHGKTVATARAGNVIGGGDRCMDRIIPDIMRSIETNSPLVLRNPNSIRPWQHVLEPLLGYLILAFKISSDTYFCQSWNFGPRQEDALTVKQIVELAMKYWNEIPISTSTLTPQVHEAKLLKLDINKTIAKLGWQPRWDSSKAIKMTFDWYREAEKQDPLMLVNMQIEEYLKADDI